MRIAIISDIHANLEALEAVLRDITSNRCDQTFCLGDVIGYGPSPNEACETIQRAGIPCVRGNHDEMATADYPLPQAILSDTAYRSLKWTREILTAEHKTWLATLPYTKDLPEIGILLAHASAPDAADFPYITNAGEAASAMRQQKRKIVCIGHTHKPQVFERQVNGRLGWPQAKPASDIQKIKPANFYLVNVGSVGQPRNGDPRSSYAIWDTGTMQLSFHKVPYPVSVTQAKLAAIPSLPKFLGYRLQYGT